MKHVVRCPACGAKMREGRPRCLRCRTPLQGGASPGRGLHVVWIAGALGVLLVGVLGVGVARAPAAIRAGAPLTAPVTAAPPAVAPSTPPVRKTPAEAVAADALDPYRAGCVAFQDGDYAAALARFQEAVARHSDDAEALNGVGQSLVRLDRPADALVAIGEAVRLRPDRPDFRFNLGVAAAAAGNLDRAVGEYRLAARLAPDDGPTRYNLGLTLHRQGNDEAAVTELQAASGLLPDDDQVMMALAISLDRLGRAAEAAAAYGRVLERQPPGPDAERLRQKIAQLGEGRVVDALRSTDARLPR